MLLADRGYDADWNQGARQPARRMGQYPTEAQSQRVDLLQPLSVPGAHLVERFFNKIKQCRRIATRYDKLAANYLASSS
jgi:transposase